VTILDEMTNVVGYPMYCSTLYRYYNTRPTEYYYYDHVSSRSVNKEKWILRTKSLFRWFFVFSAEHYSAEHYADKGIVSSYRWIVSVAILVLKEGSWYYKAKAIKFSEVPSGHPGLHYLRRSWCIRTQTSWRLCIGIVLSFGVMCLEFEVVDHNGVMGSMFATFELH